MSSLRNPGWFSNHVALVCLMTFVLSCGGKPRISHEAPYWKDNDCKPIPEPEFEEPNLIWTSVDRALFDQGLELLDLDRNVRKISGNMTEAINPNSHDEVPNSSWFTNRQGLPQTRLTPAEIRKGVNITGGPDTTGPWLVFRPKIGGVTPGFWIEDIKGNQYIIKFDPKGYPDLSTGATTMAGRFFHACGYNVPQETIVYWRPEMLRIKDGATANVDDGSKRPLTMDDIHSILQRVEQQPDGRIRSLASLLLGNVKGPYMLKGTRKDDPNDWCPHEHRRELRGLYVLASFANHFDVKDHNSMDVYVGEDGKGFLRHYLLDFGSTFGSAGHGPMAPRNGYANTVDLRDMGVSWITLGLKKWQWEDAGTMFNPSVGYYESQIFHPRKWNPIYPIPPFENMTDRDGYWGAKIMMAFRDEHLWALLEAGQYADAEAKEYLFQTMKERRDKIGRYWFDRISPLDYPTIQIEGRNIALDFQDLAVEYGLELATATYQVTVMQHGEPISGPTNIQDSKFSIAEGQWQSWTQGGDEDTLLEFRISTSRDGSHWSKETVFWVAHGGAEGTPIVVSIEHL